MNENPFLKDPDRNPFLAVKRVVPKKEEENPFLKKLILAVKRVVPEKEEENPFLKEKLPFIEKELTPGILPRTGIPPKTPEEISKAEKADREFLKVLFRYKGEITPPPELTPKQNLEWGTQRMIEIYVEGTQKIIEGGLVSALKIMSLPWQLSKNIFLPPPL